MADPTCSDEMRKLVEALAECPPCCDNAQECNKTWVHNEARAALLSAISRYGTQRDEALTAHAATFAALQAVSMIVSDGSVDDYSEIPRLVEERLSRLERDAARMDRALQDLGTAAEDWYDGGISAGHLADAIGKAIDAARLSVEEPR